MNTIEEFITSLSVQKLNELSENIYSSGDIRCWNLKIYLEKMFNNNPDILLLGEAPGYKGCRLTGIPFTSEKILKSNSFFSLDPYKFINANKNPESEQTASIFWNELNKYNKKPLIWNIYPFHPYSKTLKSNRTPNNDELNIGKEFLVKLLKIFQIKRIIAVGRKSELKLKELGLSHEYLRHPANGGKQEFSIGLQRIFR